ncbi:MAG: shufflon system plasmid conjugative transfer pilus tip adhesin PilV, partial [Muribaculaceae bacterium]|nr:shufflon system plasmid conjugative transfer pilus tip adhesin PilV [Muribaculaceae bacterium]
NSGSAVKLMTPRTLWGQSFDGTGNVNGAMTVNYAGDETGISIYRAQAGAGAFIRCYNNNQTTNHFRIGMYGAGYFGIAYNSGADAFAVTTSGNVGIGTIAPTRKLHVNGDIQTVSIYASNWFRSTGATGWYNETYGGGWYMSDTTWIRINGGKSLYAGAGTIRTDYLFTREDYAGAAWSSGYGAYNVQIYDNAAQTPLLLAYRRGTTPAGATGADRLFSMELLNTGGELRFSFGGSSVFRMTKFGEFQAIRSVQSSAWFSDSGQIRANAMGTSYYLGMGAATDGYGVIQGGNSGTGAIPLLLNPKGGSVGIGLVPSFKFHVAGDIKANGGIYTGNLTAHNGVGGSGCQICDGNIELFGSLCYIDFHHGNTTTDYTSRIIELEPGVITIEGQLHVTGGIWTEGFMTARQGNRMTALVDDHEERIAALEAENASLRTTIENMI